MNDASGDGDIAAVVARCLAPFEGLPGGLLPALHAVQAEFGCIPAESVPQLAHAFNISRAEVHGVVSFYHDFRTEPSGMHRVQICRAEACQARGARELEAHACRALDMAVGETSADGFVSLDAVYCLGNCACGPSVRIGDEVHARVDGARFDQLLASLADGESAS